MNPRDLIRLSSAVTVSLQEVPTLLELQPRGKVTRLSHLLRKYDKYKNKNKESQADNVTRSADYDEEWPIVQCYV